MRTRRRRGRYPYLRTVEIKFGLARGRGNPRYVMI